MKNEFYEMYCEEVAKNEKLMIRVKKLEKGKILLNVVDIKTLSRNSYFKFLSIMFQDFKIFDFSILENIILKRMLMKRELTKLLKKSDLLEDIKYLPKDRTSIYISHNLQYTYV